MEVINIDYGKLNKIYLMETFISQFLFSLSFQYIYIKTVSDINPKIFPIVSILSCLFSIIFANINLKSDLLFKNYTKFCFCEIAFYMATAIYCIINKNYVLFQILNLFSCCIINQAIGVCGSKIKEKIYNTSKARNEYDNKNRIYSDAAIIMSATIAFFIIDFINLQTLVLIGTLGVVFEDICLLYIYKKLKNGSDL